MANLFNSMLLSPFIPTELSNTVNWLDGADPNGNGVVPANNTALATWVDKSGFGNNFTQGTGASQPLFKTNVFSGNGAILCDGIDDFFSRTYTANLFTLNITIAIVCSVTVLNSTFMSPDTARGDTSGLRGYAIYRNPTTDTTPNVYSLLPGNGGGIWSTPISGPLAVVNTPTILIMNASGGTVNFFVNGTSYGSSTYDPSSVTPSHFLGTGGNNATPAAFYLSGHLCERVGRNVTSTTEELSLLTTYFKNKWGIL